jgi:hypothetical protein
MPPRNREHEVTHPALLTKMTQHEEGYPARELLKLVRHGKEEVLDGEIPRRLRPLAKLVSTDIVPRGAGFMIPTALTLFPQLV